MSLLAELQRRKVFKVAAAYLVVAWLAVQVGTSVLPLYGTPAWFLRAFVLVLMLGFPIALVMAWVFEVTPEGVKVDVSRVGSKRLFVVAAALVALALGWYFHKQPASRVVGTTSTRAVAPTKAAADTRSIAVLPFVDMSQGKDQEYFSDGIAEELLNRLAQFPDLKVAARTSAFQFKGKNLDIGDIGRRLNVSHVLEGSVRKGGTTLRITAQLIDSRTGFHLWSETYDRDAADVLKVQDEIASAIANELESKLGGRPAVSAPIQKVSPAAYDDYLQGRALVAKRYVENLDPAITAFDRAMAVEPNYSAAYSGRAFAELLRPLWGAPDIDASLVRARDSANLALKLDPNNAEAYMVRGMVAALGRDATAAGVDLGRALTLAPGSVDVINMYGDYMSFFGAMGDAERMKRQAIALDPLAFVHPMNLADVLSEQGRYPEAIVAAQQAVALGGQDYAFDRLVFAQVRSGHFKEARAAMEQGCAITGPTGNNCEANHILLLARSGQRAQAEAMLDNLLRDVRSGKHPLGNYTPAVFAWLYAEISNFTKAAALQREALDKNDLFPLSPLTSAPGGAKLPEEISTDPQWLSAWNDPRMKDAMTVYRRNLLAWRASRH